MFPYDRTFAQLIAMSALCQKFRVTYAFSTFVPW